MALKCACNVGTLMAPCGRYGGATFSGIGSELAAAIKKPFTRAEFAATFGRRNPEIVRELFDSNADDRAVADLGDRKEQIYRAATRRVENRICCPASASCSTESRNLFGRKPSDRALPLDNLDLILARDRDGRRFSPWSWRRRTRPAGKPDPQVFQVAADLAGALYRWPGVRFRGRGCRR